MTDTGGEVAVQAGAWSLIGAGATDRGPVRAENQDCFRLVPHGSAGLGLLLADGMGGHSGGREAAEAAVSGAADRLAAPGGEEQLREALAVANAAVAGVRLQLGGNPGTTMVAAVIEEGRLTLAHAGERVVEVYGTPERLAEVGELAAARGWSSRRSGPAVAIMHAESLGEEVPDGTTRPANLEDAFVALTGEEIE